MSVAALLPPRPALGQDAPGRLHGTIIDATTASAVAYANLDLLDEHRSMKADSAGRFSIDHLAAGELRLLVRALGYQAVELILDIAPHADLERTIRLDPSSPPPLLDPVSVTEHPSADSYRLADFERRRRTGRGHYLTESEIVQSGASSVSDLGRGMRGVSIDCGGGRGCRIHMARARVNCPPDYVVDGRIDNMFGPTTPIRDIVALEVYTGPSDVPGEYAGKTAGCGVVVIWTRSGPPRL